MNGGGEGLNALTLAGPALETAIVTRNRFVGVATAVLVSPTSFFGATALSDGARFYLNDIIDAQTPANAVIAPPDYPFDTGLSDGVHGNYWGRTCDDSDGFRENGEHRADSSNARVVDRHPYEQPVASIPDADLPPTCR